MMLAADDIGLGEMGANQVVIVRSASAKKKLPPLLRSGLVLTVEESKGLEFDDVCIFDFFADSDKDHRRLELVGRVGPLWREAGG